MRTILIVAAPALGGSVLYGTTINLNTGQSPGTIGTFSDPVWTINGIPAPPTIGLNSSGAAYLLQNDYPRGNATNNLWETAGLPSTSVANYISAGDCGRSGFTASCNAGTYSFTTQFTASALSVLTFQVAGDNRVEVYLNGVNTLIYGQGDATGGNQSGWASLSALQTVTTSNGLQIGTNTLELRVINAGAYTGGLLVGQVTDAPEPATYALTAGALIGMGLLKRRPRR